METKTSKIKPDNLLRLSRQMKKAHRIVVNPKMQKAEKAEKLKSIGYAKEEANLLLND